MTKPPELALSLPDDDPDPDAEAASSQASFLRSVVLARRAMAGDDSAFTELFDRHYESVMRSVACRLGITYLKCFQDYSEAVNQGFLEAFLAIREGRYRAIERVGAFRNWVTKICHNNALSQIRAKNADKRGGGEVELLSDLLPDGSSVNLAALSARYSTPTQILSRRDEQERLDAAVQELSEKRRKVWDLRVHCQMSFAEVATELGYANEVTVRSIWHLAKQDVRKLMRIDDERQSSRG